MAIKINIVTRLQHWMDSVPGQTFLNYAYSWGAAVVILGALFKLTHLPGGNLMLFLGMGTEVVVFFLSAFDRPFDKNEIGKELPEDYESDEEIEAAEAEAEELAAGGGTIIIGGGNVAAGSAVGAAGLPEGVPAAAVAGGTLIGGVIGAAVPDVPADEMEEATKTYVEKLNQLSEALEKVNEQTARLAHDSEEMENLNRTLTGINRIYELQLKSASSQVGTIDEIEAQTKRLAAQIEELNGVYSRMIQALTVNMKGQM